MAKVTLEEIKTVLIGIPNTDDRGMAGAINKIEEHLESLNDGQSKQWLAITKNKTRINLVYWGLTVLFSGGGITAIILKAVGVY